MHRHCAPLSPRTSRASCTHTLAKLGLPHVREHARLVSLWSLVFHGYDASSLHRQHHWSVRFKQVFAQASAILGLSEEMKANLIQLGALADRTHVVHLARNLSSFPYQPKDRALQRWLTVGRLTGEGPDRRD